METPFKNDRNVILPIDGVMMEFSKEFIIEAIKEHQELEAVRKSFNEPLIRELAAITARACEADAIMKAFAELELILNKAIDGWKKEAKFTYNLEQIEKILFRIGGLRYCLHEISELKKKYTEEKLND